MITMSASFGVQFNGILQFELLVQEKCEDTEVIEAIRSVAAFRENFQKIYMRLRNQGQDQEPQKGLQSKLSIMKNAVICVRVFLNG